MRDLLKLHGFIDKFNASGTLTITGQTIVEGVLENVANPFDPVAIRTNVSYKDIFDVTSYGAVANNSTDCRSAIQAAVDAASAVDGIVFFPPAELAYRISNYITVKSNIEISGYEATIFRPSATSVSLLFYNSTATDVENVTFRGITLKSINDQAGSGDMLGSLTSNVQGVTISGVNNLTIVDVTMDAMYIGLKLDTSSTATYSTNIFIDNLTILNTMTGIMANKTDWFEMNNSLVDCTGSVTKFLHCVYLRGDTSNFSFNNCDFQNVSGGGIHLYASTGVAPTAITFDNCRVDNALVGAYIYSGSNNVAFNNLEIAFSGVGIKVNLANNITFTGLNMHDFADNMTEAGGFYCTNFTNSQVDHVTLDGSSLAGIVFNFISGVSGITAENFSCVNTGGIDFTAASGPVALLTAKNLNLGNTLSEHYDITGDFIDLVPDPPPFIPSPPPPGCILISQTDSMEALWESTGAGYALQAGVKGDTIEVAKIFRF